MKIYAPKRFAAFIFILIAGIAAVYSLLVLPNGEGDEPPLYEAEILHVMELPLGDQSPMPGMHYYHVELRILSGPDRGSEVKIEHKTTNQPSFDIFPSEGEKVLVAHTTQGYGIADYHRLPSLTWLLLGFSVLLVFFGGLTGVRSLLVLIFSVLCIIKGLIGLILADPTKVILWTLLIGATITLTTQIVVHGRNEKAAGAIIGTLGGICVAGAIAMLAIHTAYLNGLEDEYTVMLKTLYLKDLDFRELLFAGVVLGSLGAVMDVAISISSAQYEMKRLAPDSDFKLLASSGMNVGKDVMGTMANTLVLAYIGGALPLLLLIAAQPNFSVFRVMNLNMIATECVRSLVGSIGLLCAIPITAYATAYLLTRGEDREEEKLKI